ncbi:MAG: 30S ribosomal protein S2 [Candidatus Doudnabacteria bacterium]|nr:30S ribosomal protein S2 [Candidatus Doudnabacteria bacterium]
MKEITLLELLKSGAHFGHTTSRWNPKMKPFIFTTRNNIHILDLEKTKKAIVKAAKFAQELSSRGGTILFVATKRQSKDIVKQAAVSCGMPYVNVRWLGGTFTNFKTIQRTIRKLEKLENMKMSGELESHYTKKERLMVEREIEKLKKLFEGIQNMKKLPDAIFVTDVKHDAIAVTEAQKSKVKIIGLVDTNCSPDGIDYMIPCNDDATKAIEIMCGAIAEGINEGKQTQAVVKNEAAAAK